MRKPEADGPDPRKNSLPKKDPNLKKISLTDLIPISELQEMQDSFSEVAKVSVRCVDAGGAFLTNVSNLPTLCLEYFRNRNLKEKYCSRCLPTFLGGDGIVDNELSFECLPGLNNYLIPLKIATSQTRSLILGYMIIGPVFFMRRRDKSEFQEAMGDFGVDLDEFWSHSLEIRVFSYKGIRSLLEMIENLMSRILTLAYTKLLIQAGLPGELSPEAEGGADYSSGRLREFLELFLDLISDITSGNISSVMLFDQKKKALIIKAWRGLPEEIVRKTSVGLGEGISGMAAERKIAILINEDTVDEEVAKRLKRKELFSAVVVPITCRDSICGVVNVSSDRSSPVRFDESTVELLGKAAGLAGITLEKIRP